jgi:hypothetical protein
LDYLVDGFGWLNEILSNSAMYNEAAIDIPPLFPRIASKKRCTFISAIIAHKGAAYTDQWCTVATYHAAWGILD